MNRAATPLRIAVADDEADMRQFFKELLPQLGFEVVAIAETGRQLVEDCRQTNPDMVITDIRMPETDGLDAARMVNQERPVPVVVITGHHDAASLERATSDYVMAYLSKPVKAVDLQAAIKLAMLRFDQFTTLRKEAADSRQALQDRKLVERAKGIIMKRARLDEPEAFRRLQKLASDKNRKLAEVAAMIVTAEEAIQ
jgi:response regulator NasT